MNGQEVLNLFSGLNLLTFTFIGLVPEMVYCDHEIENALFLVNRLAAKNKNKKSKSSS